jgi:hypothetical protein
VTLTCETLAKLVNFDRITQLLGSTVAEIVQCGEPILLANLTTRPRRLAFCDVRCDITLFAGVGTVVAAAFVGGRPGVLRQYSVRCENLTATCR